MPSLPLAPLALLFCLAVLGCDGPVGGIDSENGVRAQIVADGIDVTNEKGEPIHVVVYGENALVFTNPPPQTMANPGRYINPAETVRFGFSASGLVRASDGRYEVSYLTIKGDGQNQHIGERGTLELRR